MMNRNTDFIRNKIVSFSKINGKKFNASTTVHINGTFFRDGLHTMWDTSLFDESNMPFCEHRRGTTLRFKYRSNNATSIRNLRCSSIPFSEHGYRAIYIW